MTTQNAPRNPQGSSQGTNMNLMLLEATFMEIVSNIRALVRSNQDLEEALSADPKDLDFLQALKENRYIILKKRQQLMLVVTDMNRMGANIDIPSDIQDMQMDLNSESMEPPPPAPVDNRTEENLVLVEDENTNNARGDAEEGVFL